jgi:peptidoglycan biosynthesis protein MviN/MurJ (putative lipid II flippase)
MAPFGEEFWRGYWPLLLTVGAVQLSQQVDILMVARVADGAPSAYLIIMRLEQSPNGMNRFRIPESAFL